MAVDLAGDALARPRCRCRRPRPRRPRRRAARRSRRRSRWRRRSPAPFVPPVASGVQHRLARPWPTCPPSRSSAAPAPSAPAWRCAGPRPERRSCSARARPSAPRRRRRSCARRSRAPRSRACSTRTPRSAARSSSSPSPSAPSRRTSTTCARRCSPGQILVDCTVPLAAAVSGKATRSLGVWQGSAAQQAQEMVPEGVTVVAALHTVGAPTLADPEAELGEDVPRLRRPQGRQGAGGAADRADPGPARGQRRRRWRWRGSSSS